MGDPNPFYHSVQEQLAHLNLTYFTNIVKAAVGATAYIAVPMDDDAEYAR